ETVLLGDRLELGLVSGIGTVRKCRALHHLFHYRRHVLLSGDEFLDLLLCQLDLRYRDPRRCAGREANTAMAAMAKHLVDGGATHVEAPPQAAAALLLAHAPYKRSGHRYRRLSRCFGKSNLRAGR